MADRLPSQFDAIAFLAQSEAAEDARQTCIVGYCGTRRG